MIKRQLLVLIAIASFAGCSTTAIIPAKVTYTYPLGGPFGAYDSQEGIGSVAYLDNGTFELFLPLLKAKKATAREGRLKFVGFKPKRFVFNQTAKPDIWKERKDSELILRVILQPTKVLVDGGRREMELREGHLLITFPDKPGKYGDLAGKKLWLNSTTGKDEVFKVWGMYTKSKASFQDITGSAAGD